MPIHDWTRVDPGTFHDFHQAWTVEIRKALNGGVLPTGFFAMVEQIVSGPIPDVITLQRRSRPTDPERPAGGIAVADAPPRATFVSQADADLYVGKANRVVIKHRLGHVVAVIEIVSPGNKSSRHALRSFVQKAVDLLRNGVNLLAVDLFPPTARDPQGIHKAIWDEICEEPFELPAAKSLTVVAYSAGPPQIAYIEPLAVGDSLPDAPVFLDPGTYVSAPLEQTYETTWRDCPVEIRELFENP